MLHTLATYFHNLDPFAIYLGDNFPSGGIRWYGLSYLAGFIVAHFLATRIAANGKTTLTKQAVSDYIMATAIGVFIGGRLGYVIFYQPKLLFEFTSDLPFWGVLAINKGGMASHGGMIGVLLSTAYFARKHKHNIKHLWDLSAFAVPAGLFFGRLANFINGELYGRPCSPDNPFAVKFPQEMYDWTSKTHADQLLKLEAAYPHLPENLQQYSFTYADGQANSTFITTIIQKMQQGNQQLIDIVQPLLTPRHPSQLYEGILEGLILFTLMLVVWAKPKKPLIPSGLFCITYGILRFIVEYFRTPDQHLLDQEFALIGITRGQILSLPLIALGIIFIAVANKSKDQPLGGWKKQAA